MLGEQPIVSESQLAALGFATSGGRSPSTDIHCQRSMSVERWQCLFRAQPLTFPIFHRTFPFFIGVSRFFIGLCRFCIGLCRFFIGHSRYSSAHSQRPSGGGHVAIGRWSLAISQIKLVFGLARFVTTAIGLAISHYVGATTFRCCRAI